MDDMNGIVEQIRGIRGSDRVVAFMPRYELHRALKQARKAKRAADAPRRREARARKLIAERDRIEALPEPERQAALVRFQDSCEKARTMAERAAHYKASVRERLTQGFVFPGGFVMGRYRQPFVEKGLRSDRLGKAGKLFVAYTRKASHLRSSMEKGSIRVQTARKVHNLDFPIVEGNREMIGLIRIDIDGVFEGFHELWLALEELVGKSLLCMPNLVAGDEYVDPRTGRMVLHGAHLWWVLPPGSLVCGTAKGRKGPKALLRKVARGIVKSLAHIGADDRANVMLVRGKNPLSPFLVSHNWNDTCFPSLAEWAESGMIDMSIHPEQLARLTAEVQSRAGKGPSNEAFSKWQALAYGILRQAHAERNADYLKAIAAEDREDALYSFLADRMDADRLLDDLGSPWSIHRDRKIADRGAAAAAILDKVIGYASRAWDPAKADEAASKVKRGRFRHAVNGDLRQRQAQAGRLVCEVRKEQSEDTIVEVMVRMMERGEEPTKTSVARATGLHRNTVSKRWDACVRKCTLRCLDKKGAGASRPSKASRTRTDVSLHCSGATAPGTAVRQDVASYRNIADVPPSGTAPVIPAGTTLHVYGSASASTPVTPAVSRCDTSASRIVVRSTPSLWHEVSDTAPWDDDDETDDWAEIAAQEEFLAADMGRIGCDDPEPPDDWLAGSVTARH